MLDAALVQRCTELLMTSMHEAFLDIVPVGSGEEDQSLIAVAFEVLHGIVRSNQILPGR